MNDYQILDVVSVPSFPAPVTIGVRQLHVGIQHSSQRDANGRLIIKPQPFAYSRFKWNGDFAYVYDQWGNPLQLRGALGGNEPGPDAEKWQEVRDQAVVRFRSRAGNFQTNLYEIYHTRQQTINLVARNFNRIGNALFALARRDWKGLCASLGISYRKPRSKYHTNPAEVWLEYTYGWMPLLNDIWNAIDHPFRAPDYHIRTTARRTIPILEKYEGGISTELWTGSYTYSAVMDGYIRVTNAEVQAASQYGLTSPSSSAWETLPFSFVLDWALPVGPYLQLLGSGDGLEFIDCSLNSSYTINYTVTNTYKKFPWWIVNPGSTTGRGNCNGFLRIIGNPDVPLPRWKNPLTTQHLANALSLIATGLARNGK